MNPAFPAVVRRQGSITCILIGCKPKSTLQHGKRSDASIIPEAPKKFGNLASDLIDTIYDFRDV